MLSGVSELVEYGCSVVSRTCLCPGAVAGLDTEADVAGLGAWAAIAGLDSVAAVSGPERGPGVPGLDSGAAVPGLGIVAWPSLDTVHRWAGD